MERDVAVKVRLPGVVERVNEDLDLIRATARLLDRHS
jgi:predicted unusual protein kinase regulating ubiquinone biosynthesis (AarF/ABC1/UbiB family)